MGRVQKTSRGGFIERTPQEAETERGRTKGDHRGHEAALGSVAKDAGALIMPDIAEFNNYRLKPVDSYATESRDCG